MKRFWGSVFAVFVLCLDIDLIIFSVCIGLSGAGSIYSIIF